MNETGNKITTKEAMNDSSTNEKILKSSKNRMTKV